MPTANQAAPRPAVPRTKNQTQDVTVAHVDLVPGCRMARRSWTTTICLVALGLAIGLPPARSADVQPYRAPSRPLPPVHPQAALIEFSLPAPRSQEKIHGGQLAPSDEVGFLTLEDLQNIALQNNPTLVQASAQVRAADGQRLQAGLAPNPIVGYQASEVGNQGQSGQQGAFLSQEFMRRRKRQLGQLAGNREVAQTRQQFVAQRLRVLNDVRAEHFNVLVAQRALELTQEVTSISQRAFETTEGMYRGKVVPYSDVLQARIQAKSANIAVENSRHRHDAAWRRLSSVIGVPGLEPRKLRGDLEPPPDDLVWEQALSHLYAQSPVLAASRISVGRMRALLERAQVEPTPNLFVQIGLQYDNATQDTIGNVQVGVPIPILNGNQGNIQTAFADLRNAQAEVGRLELSLRNRLATSFETYSNARNEVEQYSREILPDARASLDLVIKGYPEQFNVLTMLTAQRTYAQASLAYLQALQQLGVSRVDIEGLLLTGSLREEHAIDVPRVDTGIAPAFGPGRPPVETK